MRVYGADGSCLDAGSCSLPSYATFAPQNTQPWTWTSSTTDIRALQNAGTRIAATWWSYTSFDLDVNPSDTATHQLAIYLLDWDTLQGGRKETVQITNATTGAILVTQAYTSFVNGVYAVISYTGHVHVLVTNNLSGGNAVVSGVFFDTPGGSQGPPPVYTYSHVSNLSWPAVAGATLYNVYKNGTLINSGTKTTYTDTAVSAGQTVTYGVSYILNGVESTVLLNTVTVPTP